jgi:hypothetical protein
VTFLFAIKLSPDFFKGSNIYKLWENYTQICCPSIVLARPGTVLPIIREIICIKHIILDSNRECVKGLIATSYKLTGNIC